MSTPKKKPVEKPEPEAKSPVVMPEPQGPKPEHPLVGLMKAEVAARDELSAAWAKYHVARVVAQEALRQLPAASIVEINRAVAHRGLTHDEVMAEITCQAKGLCRA